MTRSTPPSVHTLGLNHFLRKVATTFKAVGMTGPVTSPGTSEPPQSKILKEVRAKSRKKPKSFRGVPFKSLWAILAFSLLAAPLSPAFAVSKNTKSKETMTEKMEAKPEDTNAYPPIRRNVEKINLEVL